MIANLETARKETQFHKAIESIKHGVPQALLIDGQNPLMLLHNALSEGLHAQTDDECLELATSIRVVLTELVDRMANVLADHAELKTAVSRLIEVKAKKKSRLNRLFYATGPAASDPAVGGPRGLSGCCAGYFAAKSG